MSSLHLQVLDLRLHFWACAGAERMSFGLLQYLQTTHNLAPLSLLARDSPWNLWKYIGAVHVCHQFWPKSSERFFWHYMSLHAHLRRFAGMLVFTYNARTTLGLMHVKVTCRMWMNACMIRATCMWLMAFVCMWKSQWRLRMDDDDRYDWQQRINIWRQMITVYGNFDGEN